MATAESCTGGLLAGRLSARPGSSAYVLGGVAAYANRAKEELLDVPAGCSREHGAVSAEVAAALAEGARARFGADVGVGITGVAGPGGGTADKPVGTVHVCVVGPGRRRGPRPAAARLADGGAGTIRHDGDAPAARAAGRRPAGLSPTMAGRPGTWPWRGSSAPDT